VDDNLKFSFLGFGTMNGKDGKPFKTREGGVMRLENLIRDINEEMFKKIVENRSVKDTDAEKTAQIVGLSAIKYGDLSNQASKDYVFDVDRFTSFEGNTGPYILYTIVRIKSIIGKFAEAGGSLDGAKIIAPAGEQEKKLMLQLARYNDALTGAYADKAPHRLCSYIYELSNDFNSFYHDNKILTEENEERKLSWLRLLSLAQRVLEDTIHVLGFDAPERM
jgi:arginyl-tRNA synthetase